MSASKGIFHAAICYGMWGLFPLYFKQIKQVGTDEIMSHRIVWAFLFMLGILIFKKQFNWVKPTFSNKKLLLGFALSALLLSINWAVYAWAITHDKVVDASLGYFINPLFNVLLGYLILKERLRKPQWLCVWIASIGVSWLAWQTGEIPWIALTLALSFGFYGLLRKTANLGSLEGLSLETLLLLPFALGYLLYLIAQEKSWLIHGDMHTQFWLIAAGPITATPLLFFASAAKQIKLSTLGLMQYIAPTMVFALGVFLYHEPFSQNKLIGFVFIWVACLVYALDGIHHNFKQNKMPSSVTNLD